VRTNEMQTNEEVLQRIRQHLKSDVVPRSIRLKPSRISPEHPLVRRAIELARTPYGSPTLSDQALLTCPSFKMGPGQSSRSHTADEYIEIPEIQEAIQLYAQLLTDLRLA